MNFKSVPFIIVPKDNKLPIRVMSADECISSHDPQFCYGYPIWERCGKSENPFYWENEELRYYHNIVRKTDIQEGEPVPATFYAYYQDILDEWHENWKEIVGTVLEHHDEQITMKFKNFKIVSNVDTSILRY